MHLLDVTIILLFQQGCNFFNSMLFFQHAYIKKSDPVPNKTDNHSENITSKKLSSPQVVTEVVDDTTPYISNIKKTSTNRTIANFQCNSFF